MGLDYDESDDDEETDQVKQEIKNYRNEPPLDKDGDPLGLVEGEEGAVPTPGDPSQVCLHVLSSSKFPF